MWSPYGGLQKNTEVGENIFLFVQDLVWSAMWSDPNSRPLHYTSRCSSSRLCAPREWWVQVLPLVVLKLFQPLYRGEVVGWREYCSVV